jgi:hypothetical protein
VLEREQVPACQERYRVISTALAGGKTVVHVHSAERPDAGFEPVVANLKDVYFATLRGDDRRAAAA